MDYGNILTRAWKITWNNKILWLFGFLAGLGGGFNFRFNFSVRGGAGGGPTPLPPEIERLVRQFDRPEIAAILIAVACVLILVALALFVLSIIARGGLVGGIRLADDDSKVTFGEAWSTGLRYFWRTLGITLLLIAPALVFGLIAAVTVVATFGIGVLCLLPLTCVFIILFIPYAIVVWLGQIGIVVEDLGVFAAMSKGWELLKANVGPVVVLGLILFVIQFVIGLLVLVPVTAIAAPAVFAFLSDPRHPNMALLVGSGLAFLCFLPVLVVLGSIFTTWAYSVWTLMYRQLTGRAPAPAPPAPSAPPAPPQPA